MLNGLPAMQASFQRGPGRKEEMPECGSQVILCDLPVRFDTYEGCSHNCSYCFARKKQDIEEIRVHDTPATLRNFIRGKRSGDVAWVDWDLPLHWGGMSDPFQPIEAKVQNSLRCLEVFVETQYPYVFSTKGALAATEPYLSMFKQSKAISQVSMVTARYDKFETGAPTFRQRLAMLPKLAANTRRLIVRVQPYMLGQAEEVCGVLQDYKNAGVQGIVVEAMKSVKKFAGGYKLGGDYVYPVEKLKRDFERIREKCYAVGLAFYVGENRLRQMGDNRCCCGVVGVKGFEPNTANLNYLPDGIIYRPHMEEPGTGESFRTLAQATETDNMLKANSYKENMKLAARTKTFLKIMGYLPEEPV
jgi:DNA repair photolyase